MSKKLTTQEFIERAKDVHGDKYSYDEVEYIKNSVKVKIVCPTHGEFLQTPNDHVSKSYGCNLCGIKKRVNGRTDTTKNFIQKAIKKHGDKFDYAKVEYKGTNPLVKILCPTHGEFVKRARTHLLSKYGCGKCGIESRSKAQKDNKEDFISKANLKHGNYSYSNVLYLDSKTKVVITCKDHGDFQQIPESHLAGRGCPKCNEKVSKQEKDIGFFIEGLGLAINRNIRTVFKGSTKEADIHIPAKNIIIEYNGNIWHSEKFASELYNIRIKSDLAINNGLRCIHIREDQWLDNETLMKNLIKSQLGIFDNRIGARQTVKKDITCQEYKELCSHHLQGYRPASVKKGLYYKDELVACIGYDKKGELIRYVVKNGWQVLGALPKLIKGENIKFSFCDLSFFSGESYLKAGFKLDYITKPNYRYAKHLKTVSRQSMMKHKLKDKFDNFDDNLTEVENCNNNGWYRLFDAGNAKYIL